MGSGDGCGGGSGDGGGEGVDISDVIESLVNSRSRRGEGEEGRREGSMRERKGDREAGRK